MKDILLERPRFVAPKLKEKNPECISQEQVVRLADEVKNPYLELTSFIEASLY